MVNEMRADDTLAEGGDESRIYELGFHLDPELPTEEVKASYKQIRELVADKGTLVAEGEPLQIPLAYTISRTETSGRRDFDSAYFAWIAYETSAARHAEIIVATQANKRVIRFIDVLTDREAAEHSEALRELAAKAHETPEAEAEAAQSAELDAALENAAA